MGEKIIIYPASALFNARETNFNLDLVDILEKDYGYACLLPQREGFEFSRLGSSLCDVMEPTDVPGAVQSIIYFYDMGKLIPLSDVVIANLDEPVDEGVVVEISYSRMMGKHVIGFRTDSRSPYGNSKDPFCGMHFFPAYQCSLFIPHSVPAASYADSREGMTDLADRIDYCARELGVMHNAGMPDYATANPVISGLLERADVLFGGIDDVNDPRNLEKIARRYTENEKFIEDYCPGVLGETYTPCC